MARTEPTAPRTQAMRDEQRVLARAAAGRRSRRGSGRRIRRSPPRRRPRSSEASRRSGRPGSASSTSPRRSARTPAGPRPDPGRAGDAVQEPEDARKAPSKKAMPVIGLSGAVSSATSLWRANRMPSDSRRPTAGGRLDDGDPGDRPADRGPDDHGPRASPAMRGGIAGCWRGPRSRHAAGAASMRTGIGRLPERLDDAVEGGERPARRSSCGRRPGP